MPDQEDDHTKQYIPVQCHYTGHRRDPYDLDLKQYILDNAPDSPGGGVALVTYAELVALINTSGLTVGGQYLITDACLSNNTSAVPDLGLLMVAPTINKISVVGSGGFLNPDYSGEGVYSGISGYTLYNSSDANGGVWNVAKESVLVNGNVIIYNFLHYVVVDDGAFNSQPPDSNSSAYTILAKNVLNGYEEYWDAITYCFEDDFLASRLDDTGNFVQDSSYNPQSSIQNFLWGKKEVLQNTLLAEARINLLNFTGGFEANVLNAGARVSAMDATGYITNNTFDGFARVTIDRSTIDVTKNTVMGILNLNDSTGTGEKFTQNLVLPTGNVNLNGFDFSTVTIQNQVMQVLPEYADNAAALAANAQVGSSYRITGTGTVNVVI